MARRLPPQPEAAAGEIPAADQLAELVPNRPITIAGRDLVIREYGAFEGLEVAAQAAGLIGDMVAVGRTRQLTWSEARRLIGKHTEEVLAISARAADVEPEWVRGLNRQDLDQFLAVWFGVNVGFFVHEVLAQLQDEAVRQALAQAGTKSSPASPPSGSGTSSDSAG